MKMEKKPCSEIGFFELDYIFEEKISESKVVFLRTCFWKAVNSQNVLMSIEN